MALRVVGVRSFYIIVWFVCWGVLGQCGNRNYDDFLRLKWTQQPKEDFNDLSDAALIVIDMQNDFTFGNFGLPCFESDEVVKSLPDRIASTIEMFVGRGGFVVASKDWHPLNHCSFQGEADCLNPNRVTQQYQNSFIKHCTFDVNGEPTVSSLHGVTFRGADFSTVVAATLEPLIKKNQAQVVFKGFNASWDSFSVFSMASVGEESLYTGAFGLVRTIKPSQKLNDYYPSLMEMKNADSHMTSLTNILKKKNIKRIFVCGLVFDYCVHDTVMFSKQNPNLDPTTKVHLLVDLTRPALDGSLAHIPVKGNILLGSSERIILSAGEMLQSGVSMLTTSMLFASDSHSH